MDTRAANLLLVDDQPRNLDVLEAMLDVPGYQFVRAQSADEALLALLKDDFAVIILDIRMPGVSGLELAQMIKQRKRTRHIPILFLTAHFLDENDALKGYGAGGVDYLSKPINPDILRYKVGVFTDLFRNKRALAEANEALAAEVAERQRAQEALRLANETLEIRVQNRTAALTEAIADRKRVEELLRQANAQLEQRVAARTRELAAANTDLRAQMEAYQRLESEVARLVEAQRVQLGMELHDNLCQHIAATGMRASTLAKRLREQRSSLADMASQIVTTLGEAGADAHAMARGLLPVQVEGSGLMVALAGLAQRTQELQGVACEFECAAPVPVENNTIATYMFRIAQEAIHNAIRHGSARRIVVTLANHDGVALTVRDDGVGIPPEGQRSPGSGLRIMAYRARVIGATLGVERAASGGTLVQCILREGAGPS